MIKHIKLIETILYIADQEVSSRFNRAIFRLEPDLEVRGMTEFMLSDNCRLGVMPNKGIAKNSFCQNAAPGSGNWNSVMRIVSVCRKYRNGI